MQRIYIGVGAVLGLAAILILVGMYWTIYRPPRAHVLTVADHSYNATDVVDRGVYLAFYEGGAGSIADLARDTVDVLIEDEALRVVGPTTVDPVTPEDIRHELDIDLGLVEDDPTPEATSEATGTATATPTPEPTATSEPTASPTVDAQAFADALTAFLRDAGLDRDEYEAIIEARLYRERLRDHFTEEVGTSGAQVRLQRIRVSTPLAADQVIEDLEGGADFAELATEQSVAEEDGEGGEIGWTVPELQSDDVQAAIADLEAGEWSEPIAVGLFFEIYRVAEVAEDREYEDAVRSSLAGLRLDDWLEEAIATLEVDEDLSADEESWINDHVLSDVTSRLGG
jgi:hypothetical protein